MVEIYVGAEEFPLLKDELKENGFEVSTNRTATSLKFNLNIEEIRKHRQLLQKCIQISIKNAEK